MTAGLMVLFAVAAFAPLEFIACKTTPTVSQATYNTLDGVGASVDAAMKVAAALKVSGKISDAQWQTVASKHALYLNYYNQAVTFAAGNLATATAPPNVVAAAQDITTTVNALPH
jgi:hypothetical protein